MKDTCLFIASVQVVEVTLLGYEVVPLIVDSESTHIATKYH